MAAPALRRQDLHLYDANNDESRSIADACDGDPQAQSWLAQHFSPVVYRFALRMMRNEQDARDATQETMVKVLRNLHRYDDRWRFQTWILSIARNTCIDEFRRRRHRSSAQPPDIADPTPGPLELSSQRQRATTLHVALGQVPPLYREVLVLYHFEHLMYREIAELLDIPIGTVMNRIFRARKKLRQAYEGLADPDAQREGPP